jgi:DNA-binding NarL/FixJ family response regulator
MKVTTPRPTAAGPTSPPALRPGADESEEGDAHDRPTEPLSPIDARILEGIAAGLTTAHLAAQLYLSRQGIDYHITGLLRRFTVPNRTALVCRAFADGLFRPAGWPPRIRDEVVDA